MQAEDKRIDLKEEFRKFFVLASRKYGISKALRGAIWAHLKAIKVKSPAEFLEGLKSFGIDTDKK
jgi:hypothetical protein